MIRRTGLWRYAGLFPERKLRSAVWRRGRCWNITANTPRRRRSHGSPCSWRNTALRRFLGFSETGHTYVLCDGEALLGMGGVRKTGEDECLIYGLFLTPEAIGKGYGTMLFHALEADELYTQCSRAWLIPTTGALGFYEKMGYTYMDGYRVRRKDDGLFYMEKHLK